MKVIGTVTFNFMMAERPAAGGDGPLARFSSREPNLVDPPPLTDEQKEKLVRSKLLAERFIQRWRDTLEFEVVFNEMFASSPEYQRYNFHKFAMLFTGPPNRGADGSSQQYESMLRSLFFAFCNVVYLQEEYRMTIPGRPKSNEQFAPEIQRALRDLTVLDRNSPPSLKDILDMLNQTAMMLRGYLPASVFESAAYQANLKNNVNPEATFRIGRARRFGAAREVEFLELRQGVFTFYMIEEDGQLRIVSTVE